MTLLEEIHGRHKAFHQRIAARASLISMPKEFRADHTIRDEESRQVVRAPVRNDHIDVRSARAYEEGWYREICGLTEYVIQPRASVRRIQEVVCAFYNLRLIDLISRRRTKELVKPRWVAFYLAREITLKSLPEIGRIFGGRDHTTVLHGLRKMEWSIFSNDVICDDLDAIRGML